MADGIRYGSRSDIFQALLDELDASAKKAFLKNSNKIANQLDYIASIPDVTIHVFREKLYYFLNGVLKVPGGSTKVIVEGIITVLNVFL